jgi:endo-1,4-beta-mannosidase
MPKFLVRAAVIAALLVLVLALRSFHRAPIRQTTRDVPVEPPTLPACTDAEIEAAFDALSDYQPSASGDFVRVQDGQLTAGDEPFLVRGVNYYPSRYPWRRFLTQTDAATVDRDFALFESVEFNTLRIFLWNEALFTCPGSGAVPAADAFLRLDGIVHKAAEYHLRLIVTLNDLPDLTGYPLYDNPPHVLAQTRFIVERYRDEAAILAWDLRNEGDIDYERGAFTREAVLDWLDQTSTLVRSLDAHHLITAGWLHDSEATIPYVDLVSFHHWSGVPQALSRIAALQEATDKPVLLQEFGYSTLSMDSVAQATLIGEVIHAVEQANTAGWLIWTAFDFPTDATCTPPNCPSQDNAEHHFGIWSADYTPKPVISVLTP